MNSVIPGWIFFFLLPKIIKKKNCECYSIFSVGQKKKKKKKRKITFALELILVLTRRRLPAS